MRTALITGLLAAIAVAWFNFFQALSNADFAYMCCGAALVDHTQLLISPYFPPGYPLLLWLLVKCGLTALQSGVLLSALGAGMCAAAVTYMARRWGLPPMVALGLGLLGATLPDVFQIAFNPHVDALFTGIAAVFLAAALNLISGPHTGACYMALFVTSMMLVILRYHALLVIVPVMLVLMCYRVGWWGVLFTFLGTLFAAGWVWWAMDVTYGRVELAVTQQVATGEVYREQGAQNATVSLFTDYQAWMGQAPEVDWEAVSSGIFNNWLEFLKRKAVWIGLTLWILALFITRRRAWGSVWLMLFILLYTLALSPTYFTARASALPELAGIMLIAAALSVLAHWRGPPEEKQAGFRFDPLLLGLIAFILCFGGVVYNVVREAEVVRHWRSQHQLVLNASSQALELAGGHRERVYGPLDLSCWPLDRPFSLPGATYSRFWMDDPRVAPQVDELLPQHSTSSVLRGQTPVKVVLLWDGFAGRPAHPLETDLMLQLRRSGRWREVKSDAEGARIWVRR